MEFKFEEDGSKVFCPFCLTHGATLKPDKRRKPVLWCPNCWSRAFIGERQGLRGFDEGLTESEAKRLEQYDAVFAVQSPDAEQGCATARLRGTAESLTRNGDCIEEALWALLEEIKTGYIWPEEE